MPGGKNVATGTIALDPNTPPVLGQPLNFICTVNGLHGNQIARVLCEGFQDTDNDSQIDDLVYGEVRSVVSGVAAFDPLGGGGSDWLTNGGPAECVGTLFFYDNVHGQQTYVQLAQVSFSAAGA